MKRIFAYLLLILPVLSSCDNLDYDISKGVDSEVTLFSDKVSAPVGDVGPLSMGILLDKTGLREQLDGYVGEDEDGFIVLENTNQFYSSFVLMFSMLFPDTSVPIDYPVGAVSDSFGSIASSITSLGVTLAQQVFTLYAQNPLTEDISVSGKMRLVNKADDGTPAVDLVSEEFTNVPVAAGAEKATVLKAERSFEKAFTACELENVVIHLPASYMEKDPLGGMSIVGLGYDYKSYLSLGETFSFPLSYDINDMDLPLAQYLVKEARICTEVSNEIPVTFVMEKMEVLVEKTDAAGNTYDDVYENVSITPGLRIASGCKNKPTVSPLEIEIKAVEGTIPDISGLRLTFTVLPPTGEGDQRLGMNQNVNFNNIRATISGGITIQGQ